MSIKIEKTENKNELKLEFTIEAKKFDDAILKVYQKSARYFNIPGFRKGKAPFNIVERMYGDEIFYEDAFNELVPEIYEKEIEENKIEAVSKPNIDIVTMKKGENLVFTAIVQTKPEVKLGKYKGIELKNVEYPVTDEDVEHELSHMQEHNARIITVEDRAVKEAMVEMEGKCTCPKDLPYCVCNYVSWGKVLTKKPILPSDEEQEENSRSRSAKLRVFERIDKK